MAKIRVTSREKARMHRFLSILDPKKVRASRVCREPNQTYQDMAIQLHLVNHPDEHAGDWLGDVRSDSGFRCEAERFLASISAGTMCNLLSNTTGGRHWAVEDGKCIVCCLPYQLRPHEGIRAFSLHLGKTLTPFQHQARDELFGAG